MDYLGRVSNELWLRFWSSCARTELTNLALTCTAFRDLFQPLLFEHLRVVLPDGQWGPKTEIDGNRDALIARFSNIAANPRLAGFVKSVYYADELEMGNPGQMDAITAFKEMVPEEFFETLPKFANVHTLAIHNANIDIETEVREPIEKLPNLRVLTLSRVALGDGTGKILPLESFTFQHGEWAAAIIDAATIRRLVLRGESELAPFIAKLKNKTLPRLTHLELDVSKELPEAKVSAFLQQCPNLESLVLVRHPARTQPAFSGGPMAIVNGMPVSLGAGGGGLQALLMGMNSFMNGAGPDPRVPAPPPAVELRLSLPSGATALVNLRELRCPYGFAVSLLPHLPALQSLELLRSDAEASSALPTAAIEAAAAPASSGLRKLSLMTPLVLDASTLGGVFSAMTGAMPHLSALKLVLQDARAREEFRAGSMQLQLPPAVCRLEIEVQKPTKQGLAFWGDDVTGVQLGTKWGELQGTGALEEVALLVKKGTRVFVKHGDVWQMRV
ncbi:hypothetical protein MKEN_00269800 [Mycena kentingensis (nom. inval.)]|nr:hypothetical protein MKEN_00269800 [Mycena kentingensis (nom. inval.)]